MRNLGAQWSGSIRAVLAATALVVVAGCGHATLTVGVDPSGSAIATFDFYPDDQSDRSITPEEKMLFIEDVKRRMPGLSVEAIKDGRGSGFRAVLGVSDVSQLAAIMANPPILPEDGPDRIRMFDSVSIEQTSPEHWSFVAHVRPTLDVFREGAASQPQTQQMTRADMWQSGTSMRVIVTLPGNVQSTNGEVTDAGSAEWSMKDMVDGGVMELSTSPAPTPAGVLPPEPSPSLFERIADQSHLGPWIVGGALGLVVAVVAVGAIRRRREENGPHVVVSSVPGSVHGYPAEVPPPAWQPHRSAAPLAGPTGPASTPVDASAPSAADPQHSSPDPAPAGWYPDPTGSADSRWWTGADWSDHTS